jgi:hypothetical protein
LSPLLFIILADNLQQLIKTFSSQGLLQHPIVPDQTCPVIQYVDNTLILFQGYADQAQVLKEILEVFSVTTGVSINYAKSTFVPINLDMDEKNSISNILGCPVASFPQTYLGLPLSNSKLPRWALYPQLSSIDNRVDTLSIKDVTSRGRLTLTKSVLSALPSHLQSCIKAPKWFYQEVDKRRRAYFWVGQNTTSGAKCKVAWDIVC